MGTQPRHRPRVQTPKPRMPPVPPGPWSRWPAARHVRLPRALSLHLPIAGVCQLVLLALGGAQAQGYPPATSEPAPSPALTTAASPTRPTTSCQILDGWDLLGPKTRSTGAGSFNGAFSRSDHEACEQHCIRVPDCVAWVFWTDSSHCYTLASYAGLDRYTTQSGQVYTGLTFCSTTSTAAPSDETPAPPSVPPMAATTAPPTDAPSHPQTPTGSPVIALPTRDPAAAAPTTLPPTNSPNTTSAPTSPPAGCALPFPNTEAPRGCCDEIAVGFPASDGLGRPTSSAFVNGTYVRTDNTTSDGLERYLSCDGRGHLYSARSQGSGGMKWFIREDDGVLTHTNADRTIRANNANNLCPDNGALNWQDRVENNWVDWPVTITCHSRSDSLLTRAPSNSPITDTTIAPPLEDTLAPTLAPITAPTVAPTGTLAPSTRPTTTPTEASETLSPTAASTATGGGNAPSTAPTGSPSDGRSSASSSSSHSDASEWLLPMVIILAFVATVAVVVAIVALRRSGQKSAGQMTSAASIWASRPATTPNPAYVGTHPIANAAMSRNPVDVGTTSPGSPAMLPNPVYEGTPPQAGSVRSPNPMYVGLDSGGGGPPGNFTIVPGQANPAAYDPVSSNQCDSGLSATDATYASIDGPIYEPLVQPVYKVAPVGFVESPHVYEYDTQMISPESKMPYAVASAAPAPKTDGGYEDPGVAYKDLVDDGGRYSNPAPDTEHGAPETRGNGASKGPDVSYQELADDGGRYSNPPPSANTSYAVAVPPNL